MGGWPVYACRLTHSLNKSTPFVFVPPHCLKPLGVFVSKSGVFHGIPPVVLKSVNCLYHTHENALKIHCLEQWSHQYQP